MEPEWNRSIIDEGKGAMEIEWEPESLDPGNVKPPLPFPAGEPNNQGTAVVPPTNRPPNDDTIGDLTSELRNFHIVQCPEEKGIKNINDIDIDKGATPKGTLFPYVQDGLKYAQPKANLHACCGLDPVDIITINVGSCLSQIIEDRKKNAIDHGEDIDYDVSDQESNQYEVVVYKGPPLMGQIPSVPLVTHQVSNADVFVSARHSLEGSSCAWSPTDSLLAIGSSNASAQIWKISNDFSNMHASIPRVHFLIRSESSDTNTCELSVPDTIVAWNGEGELLATGSTNGWASIWCKNGELHKTLDEHEESISCIAWNSKGDLLLIGSYESEFIIWDTITWKPKQKLIFDLELLPVVIVAWRNNTSFTICSRDFKIFVWNVGDSQPIITFTGHQDDISGIKWDPTGTLLASYSDDGAIKIWTLKQDQSLHNLMHCEGINSIRWSWTGPGTSNPNKQLLLASAANDGTVKIWDGARGQLLYSFNGHRTKGPVIEMEFSPDGDYIASESEQCLLIWKVKDGTIVKFCSGCDPWRYNLSWNREGNKIAAGYTNGSLRVLRLW
ncbi:WD40 repeat-containing protein HOS15-like isoform X1 [Dioscorea cayenensis subsp. rotundata]|uniref:WD40 repeat-containing protein HOS15-like isoform X1 n=1 Tax=Dioscorea cayennensis subsp. rotundata TaxID=55577 RepID=A0AB40D275_DIOCR|nr:WD40 repeat-containing protein HOS15-like isoform X1 [Dioscorea cayenensis subsp. rotundata]